MDLRSGIQQNTVSHRCTVLDTGVLQHHTAIADFCERTDIGTGSNDVGKSKAKCFCFLIHLRPELVVADAHHQQAVLPPQLRQISKAANHRNTTDLSAYGLSIVYESTVVLVHCLFCNHASEAACTNQQ